MYFSIGRYLSFLVGLLLILPACNSSAVPVAATAEIDETSVLKTAQPPAVAQATATPRATATAPITAATSRYQADDERISYIGRFDFRDPKRPEFDWSGVAIELTFVGTSLAIFIEELDGSNVYNVTVDDRSQVLKTEIGQERYLIAEGLAPGVHHFRMVKRTEAVLGAAVFGGVEITGDGLLEPPPAAERRIEFIGDSITSGFGNEGDSPECFFSAETQNAETTFAAMAASELDAEYSLIALSGLGVYYPLQVQGVASSETAIEFIDRALAYKPDIIWPPEQQTPDAVVISLGTNDFSADPNPEDEAYIEVYMELLSAVRMRYPEAHIFAVAGPLVFGAGPQTIETAVDRFRSANSDDSVTYVFIEDNLERSEEDFGCAWHPNVHGHQKIAAQLTPAIAAQLGW